MKRFLAIILLLASTVGIVYALVNAPGYVLVVYRNISVEISLLVYAILSGVIILIAFGLLKLVMLALRTPARIKAARMREAILRGRRDLEAGISAFLKGHHAEAQRLLGKAAEAGPASAPLCMLVSCAAQLQGDGESVARWLEKARLIAGADDKTLRQFEAACLLDSGRFADACEAIRRLRSEQPDDEHLLHLHAQCLRGIGDRESLRQLLPTLKAAQTIDEDMIESYSKWALTS